MYMYKRALTLMDETVLHRRFFHKNAETGLDMPKAVEYVMSELEKLDIHPYRCGKGVAAIIGKGEKCILLRTDMDALPMKEQSGVSFAAENNAHTCGHDLHAAMLLTAAKLLKEDEKSLDGCVKLMFQPAEETLEGARNMTDNGILTDPAPQAALAFHVGAGKMPPGIYMYNDSGTMMFSSDGFRIKIKGRGAHGAYPHHSVDPVNIAVHIYLALEAIIAREANPDKACIITVGSFNAGSAANIIPETAELCGTIRTNDVESRKILVKRTKETAIKTAEVYGGTADVEMTSEVPPLICNGDLVGEMAEYIDELEFPDKTAYKGISSSASEDFAVIAEKIPSAYFYLSAGFADERGDAPAHNPKVMFDEKVLPIGAAAYAYCAERWLENDEIGQPD